MLALSRYVLVSPSHDTNVPLHTLARLEEKSVAGMVRVPFFGHPGRAHSVVPPPPMVTKEVEGGGRRGVSCWHCAVGGS